MHAMETDMLCPTPINMTINQFIDSILCQLIT